ncbi:hypothetical protein [Streptomyces olivaceiscleroticus]|uniref:Uncharacterized protein n=1 Tax=Streptomyces olivaceiscleroticus TaxID=68245 RepID=A0ABP3JCN4_9ACTN
MSLGFQIVTFRIPAPPCGESFEDSESFKFDNPIAWERRGRPNVDVALRTFDLRFLSNGSDHEYAVGREFVKLDVSTNRGHRDGVVNLEVQLRPMSPPGRPDLGYKGLVEALVIAEVLD